VIAIYPETEPKKVPATPSIQVGVDSFVPTLPDWYVAYAAAQGPTAFATSLLL
jgi:hypothetical protein